MDPLDTNEIVNEWFDGPVVTLSGELAYFFQEDILAKIKYEVETGIDNKPNFDELRNKLRASYEKDADD